MIARKHISLTEDNTKGNDVDWYTLDKEHLLSLGGDGASYKGEVDLSAKVSASWDKDHLYVRIIVKDDINVPPSSAPSAWEQDSIQLYFDQLNNAEDGTEHYDGDDISYTISSVDGHGVTWLDKGSEGRYIGEANASTGLDRDVKVDVHREQGKPSTTSPIPSECLPQVTFKTGTNIGFFSIDQ